MSCPIFFPFAWHLLALISVGKVLSSEGLDKRKFRWVMEQNVREMFGSTLEFSFFAFFFDLLDQVVLILE